MFLTDSNINDEVSKNLLVDAAEDKIKEYEKQCHARSGSNTNVEGGVV